MARGSSIAQLWAGPLDAAMNEPFAISRGATDELRNVLTRVRLEDGAVGYGEGAPFTDFNNDSQARTLKAVMSQRAFLVGRDISRLRPLLEELDRRLPPARGAARAALSMALTDAWARRAKVPLRALFGAARKKVFSDVTVTIVPPEQAQAAAKRIVGMGIRTIKIKVGRDIDDDCQRVLAVASVSPRLRLLLDSNCGYSPRESLKLLSLLKRRGIIPALFEQPAAKEDWEGLKKVHRDSGVPVAVDESVSSRKEALAIAKKGCAQVINVKLMKSGLLEAWDIALIARAAGLGLMIGGMIETTLAMTCAAHLAAGLGGFDFVDLDTPLWLKKDPMRGVRLGRGGVYDLSRVKAGIGVTPAV